MKWITLFVCLVLSHMLAAFAGESPKIGDTAPPIEAKDQDGINWKLSDHLGKKALILYFYPRDDTPGCTKEACGFRDLFNEFKDLGVSVVGVSRDDAASHKQFRAKHSLNFSLLVDTDGKITEAFGASAPDKPRSRRVSFLISRSGKILHFVDDRDAQVHLDQLKDAVGKLKR